MTDSININAIKDALKTGLEALTWQPSGNTDVTSFVGGVFTYSNLQNNAGSPWVFIMDSEPTLKKKAMGGLFYEKRTPIDIYICSNWKTIGLEEAERRLIYAYEAVESYITKKTTMDTIGAPGYEYIGYTQLDNSKLKVKVRRLRFIIQSRLSGV